MLLRRLTLMMAALLVAVTGCNGSSGGGITIPNSDGSAPTVSLQAGATAPSGESAAVSSGGLGQAMTLRAKTGFLNLVASAKDPESGVQSLEIWLSSKITRCSGDICQTSQPSVGAPRFQSSTPQKKPGEQASDSSILADVLDIANEIPQTAPTGGSLTVEWTLFSRAKNHLAGSTDTPPLTVTYRETA